MSSESPIHEYIAIAFRRKWLLIVPTVVSLGVSALILGKLPRVYEATAKVTEDRGEVQFDGGRRGNSEAARMALVRLQLDDFADPVAHKVYNVPDQEKVEEKRISKVKNSLELDTYGDLIYFKAHDLDPEFAARVANFYAEEFVDWTIKKKRRKTGQEASFFDNELREKKAALEAKDQEIAKFKDAHRGALPEDVPFHNETMERLRDDLAQSRADLSSRIDERTSFISALQLTTSRPVEATATPTPTADPETKLRQLEAQLAAMRLRLTEKHPDVLEKQREILVLKEEIAADAVPRKPVEDRSGGKDADDEGPLSPVKIGMVSYNQLMQMNRDITRLRARIANLESDIGKHQGAISGGNRISAEWDSLSRERTALANQYDTLFNQAAKADRDVAYTDTYNEKFRLQQPAEIPKSPVSPVPLKVLGFGLGLGLAAGIGLAFLAEMLDQTYKSADDVARDVDVPVVATIARIDAARKVVRIDSQKKKVG